MTISPVYVINKNMRPELLALFIQEGTKICSEILRFRLTHPKLRSETIATPPSPAESQEVTEETSEGKIEKGTACLPCTNSHLHACVGLLSEAVRMSPDGITVETIKRTDACLGEIVAAERIDLSPINVASLPPEERKIADYASRELREIRHGLEGLKSPEELEKITVRTVELQRHVGSEWFKYRLKKMSKDEKRELAEKTIGELEA